MNWRVMENGPHIDFRYTVSSYALSLFRIYKRFLDLISVTLLELKSKVCSFVSEKSELVNHKKVEYNNLLFYIVLDQYPNELQVINIEDDIEKMLINYTNSVVSAIKKEKTVLQELKKHIVLIK